MLLRKKRLHGETEAQFNALNHQPENNDHIADYILEHNGQLPPQPLFEKHPYLDDFELQDLQNQERKLSQNGWRKINLRR